MFAEWFAALPAAVQFVVVVAVALAVLVALCQGAAR